jgi:prepilin-type processing-associated H-X9-DG protein
MREDLLGYLLSALEPHEMRRIDQRLQEDPLLREELANVQRMLNEFDQTVGENDLVELPPDLISRTLDSIDAAETLESDGSGFANASDPDAGQTVTAGGSHSLFSGDSAILGMRPERLLPSKNRQSWADMLVSALAAAAILALAFPVVARYRGEARKMACQNNLRQLGVAIGDYVLGRTDSRLPQVAESGHEAFSGIWELRLTDRGLLTDPSLRWCADGEIPDEECPRNCEETQLLFYGDRETGTKSSPPRRGTLFSRVGSHDLINSEHLMDAAFRGDIKLLKFIQRVAGGHYAYNLGVIDNGKYQTPRYEGRSSFAVLGDMPIAGRQTADGIDVTTLKWHHGEGANILYEDGSVRHVRPRSMIDVYDHPYTNHRGSIAAGVNIDDASLGPSWYAPTPEAIQR